MRAIAELRHGRQALSGVLLLLISVYEHLHGGVEQFFTPPPKSSRPPTPAASAPAHEVLRHFYHPAGWWQCLSRYPPPPCPDAATETPTRVKDFIISPETRVLSYSIFLGQTLGTRQVDILGENGGEAMQH